MKPRPLTPAARVAVALPASAPLTAASYEVGLAALRATGLTVEAPPLMPSHGYLAATDIERLDAFNALLRRPDLDAIFVARGGYGTMRLLPHLDYAAARTYPKLVIGYSDVTALHAALWTQAELPGLAGPMVAPDWSRFADLPAGRATADQFWTLAGGAAPVELVGPEGEGLVPMQPGVVEGRLFGGNLTMLAALLGTPYLPDLRGAILFLEEVGEAPYRIDRLLMQFRLAGVLEHLGGLVLGAFTACAPPANRPSLALDDVLAHYAACIPGPVARGLVFGHLPIKNTVPFGVHARLAVGADEARLTVLEPVAAAPA